MLAIVLITGGFVIQTSLFRLSSRGWHTPLFTAIAVWLAAGLLGRSVLADAMGAMAGFIERRSTAAAVVLTAAAVGVGVGFGTYAASGSDASGYVSQAELLASGHLARDEPLARDMAWSDPTWSFSPLGYRPGRVPGEVVPTYPPGLPLMMAAASLIDQESGPYLIVPILAGLAVFCTYLIGTYLHSRTAGVFAAALLCTSPIFLFQAVQPMSDVPATALWSLALVLALRRTRRCILFAGLVAGGALLTRPNLLPFTIVVAAALLLQARPFATADDRPRSQRLLIFIGGMAPILAVLLLLQWRLYGNPLHSGYGGPLALFSTSNVRQNVPAYALRMLRGEAPAWCLVLIALVIILNRPRNAADRRRFGHLLLLASLAVAAILLCYLPYSVFADWFYLRFLLPAFPLVFTLAGASVVHAAGRLSPRVTGLFLLLVLAATCSFNVLRAEAERAFNLRDFEARYRIAGRYLQSMLPPEAVVVTVQESGSVRYYTRKPILRWDQLGTDIEAALVSVRSRGRRPMLLLEDWETADFQSRFTGSSLARLDWQPRADFGDITRVRLFDPADRTDPARRPITDRLH